MIKNFLFILFLFVINTQVFAQTEDTLQTVMATDTIFSENDATNDSIKLLPSNYLITQRLLWSEKGLMRNFDYFKLSEASRDRELEIRNTMFTAHQYVGYATLAGMIAQGFVGQKLANGDKSMRGLHEGLAGAVNFGYFTTAGLAFRDQPSSQFVPEDYSLNFFPCTCQGVRFENSAGCLQYRSDKYHVTMLLRLHHRSRLAGLFWQKQ